MKIPASIRTLYEECAPTYKLLKEKVDIFSRNKIPEEWHYFSRIKSVESFALKAETGRHSDLKHLEDFFACTIVVENLSKLAEAEKYVSEWFSIIERRPQNINLTHKDSASFIFDDLRLYVKWKDSAAMRPTGLNGVKFEVQIKTYLQHAWSIATHDLIYKSDQKIWAKERIAFQVKAMLEHAEIVIQEADKVSKLDALNKSNDITKNVNQIIAIINEAWASGALPSDKTRLANTVANILYHAEISASRLADILRQEKNEKMDLPSNLSPYGTIIQVLLKYETEKIKTFLYKSNKKHRKDRILLYPEIEIPDTFDPNTLPSLLKL